MKIGPFRKFLKRFCMDHFWLESTVGLDLSQKSSKSDYFWDKIDVIGRITVGSLIFDFYENLKIIIYEAWNEGIVRWMITF